MLEAIETEKSVIGSVLLECDQLSPIAETVSPRDFIAKQHRLVWQAILGLRDKGEPIDLVTVSSALSGVTPAPDGGWTTYLSEIIDVTPTSANLTHYVRVLQAGSRRRDFIAATTMALEKSKDKTIDGDELMTDLVTELARLEESRALVRPVSIREASKREFDAIEERAKTGGPTGLRTGFDELDGLTGGLQDGEISIIAARPGMGKSALAENIVRNVSVIGDRNSLIFSLEMSNQVQTQRFMSVDSRVDLRRIRTGKLRDDDWSKLSDTMGKLYCDRVYLVDKPALTIAEMRSIARQHSARHKVDLIVVDYLQLMRGRGENREQAVANISRGLKAIAMELHVPLIAIAQLNRSVESRQDKRPMLSDLRESGSIEQDADVVMLLYRDDYYNHDSEKKGVCEVAIAKARNGPTGTLELRWFESCTRFEQLS